MSVLRVQSILLFYIKMGLGSKVYGSEKGVSQLISDLDSLLINSDDAGDLSFKPEKTHYPDVSPEVFRIFLKYVYTGKLSVEEPNLFPLYTLANEFDMSDLKATCDELISKNLSPASSCTILNSALSTKQSGLDEVIDKCINYIGENPNECIKATNFLSLPVETITRLISSDQFCLEEEEVWRAVLRWAQYKADVDSHVSRWTEEERKKVSKFLNPVISHVRLLLIDSRLFAEEIEPTGCVPMALSLERYRFAAVPHQFEKDPRLTPRNSPRIFQNSQIIHNERLSLGRKLNDMIPSAITENGECFKQSWKLVYRASTHGFSADAFHRAVDGLSPTVTIILIDNNAKWICGGYTDQIWQRSKPPKYATSSKSFLFCYDGKPESEPVRFSVTKKHFAVCHDANSGPIFGAGADLYISSNCNSNTDSYSNLPHSYELDNQYNNQNGEHQPQQQQQKQGTNGTAKPLEPEGSPRQINSAVYENTTSAVLTPSYQFTVADYEVFVPTVLPMTTESSCSF
ncbi:Kelch-like protein 2 [Orchesella cincta]|uniref:Kelch-like protein 2 n=1 Tax=Orchesella cincta TaxID=48709 RepID=A0A1D2MZN5_ORCCI|nr:Kelch-like protein 2 [Orchesella cincta]